MQMNRRIRILGTRGIPAAHGGFETFAERLALYLTERGWHVIVYCQVDAAGPVFVDTWNGIERVNIPIQQSGPKGTVVFDWLVTLHAAKYRDLCLTLGYNTAIFCTLLRLKAVSNVINMDGIEWSRAKWGAAAKAWFWFNDWVGCWVGNHLVADHPKIALHLKTRVSERKITTIPYGADAITSASSTIIEKFGLTSKSYLTVVARAEPENSLLEIVEGFSEKPRGIHLAILGNYDEKNSYHRAVRGAAGAEVRFLGAIYDKVILNALRFHCLAYVHGHQVGGTNPSLVEALGAGNAVVAHDNRFNRWVAGEGGLYFDGAAGFAQRLDELLADRELVRTLSLQSRKRFDDVFTWPLVLEQYERLLEKFVRS